MSTMLVELYDALKEAGASEAKARAAAESLVLGRDRLERIEEQTDKIPRIEEQTGRLPKIEDQIDDARTDIARLDKELAVVKAQIDPVLWMNGIVIAGVLALIIKTFFG
jgi:chromosome segregation ATPase